MVALGQRSWRLYQSFPPMAQWLSWQKRLLVIEDESPSAEKKFKSIDFDEFCFDGFLSCNFWRASFGAQILARKFWRENFDAKIS